jgi:PrcB C-terminal
LSEAIGASVPEAGSGAYLATYWGEKPTGGYSLAVGSARLEGDRVTVRLILEEPAPDAIVTQALTYPYAVAFVRDLDPRGKDFAFLDREGRELRWPVRLVEGH